MPKLVYININSLRSLPKDQLSCGMGEVIKYGMIMDSDFYDWLGEREIGIEFSDEDLFYIVEKCLMCKKKVVEEDPKEKGIRSYLNFGHTIGHAIEKLSDFNLFHGQCVAIGMVAALYLTLYGNYESKIRPEDIERLKSIIIKYDLPTMVPAEISGINVDDVIEAMRSDKKAEASGIKFVVLEEIGKAAVWRDFSDEDYKKAISFVLPE